MFTQTVTKVSGERTPTYNIDYNNGYNNVILKNSKERKVNSNPVDTYTLTCHILHDSYNNSYNNVILQNSKESKVN